MDSKELDAVRAKIARYCAYRERATKEVIQKLDSFGLEEPQKTMLVSELRKEGYLDDERFAKLYSGGKFRQKKWGKLKIKRELRLKGISEETIQKGLEEIEGQTYLETLEQLALSKFKDLKETNLYIRKNKVAAFLVSKGYESELVWGVLNKLN